MPNEIDLSRTELNLLVLFEAVLRERHVGRRAAARLNLTASAVSHGLGRLRRLLDDPLFLRTPKGVTPTDRALELAEPVADLLARARRIVAAASPFDPVASRRRFALGAPDAVGAVLLGRLLAALERDAPGVDLALRQVLPGARARAPDGAWADTSAALESRDLDVVVVPIDAVPARFPVRAIHREDFVTAAREGHPYLAASSLDRFCAERHMVVSQSGDPRGFVDERLAALGRARRVALTVPNFMMAVTVLGATDLLAAPPRRAFAAHGARFGLGAADLPFAAPAGVLRAVIPKAALLDAGLAWFFETLCAAGGAAGSARA